MSGVLLMGTSADAPPQVTPVSEDGPYARPTSLTGIPGSITLYQYEVCPFCCKVKAALDFYKLPYTVVEVNPLTKSEVKWSKGYRKVPIVKFGDEVLTESSAIVSRIAAEAEAAAGGAAPGTAKPAADAGGWFGSKARSKDMGRPAVATPLGGVTTFEEMAWRKWVDERFVKLITANIYRNWDESQQSFKYITEQTNWSWGTRELARYAGAVIMWQVGKKMPAKYNIEGDLREALYAACNEYVDAVGPGRPFLGGATPNLADLAVYGVLTAVAKTPTFNDAMQHSRIADWYARAADAIGPSSRVATLGSEWGLAKAGNPVTGKAA